MVTTKHCNMSAAGHIHRHDLVGHHIQCIRDDGTVSGQSGQSTKNFCSLPSLVFSLPTLDLITWVGIDPPAIT